MVEALLLGAEKQMKGEEREAAGVDSLEGRISTRRDFVGRTFPMNGNS